MTPVEYLSTRKRTLDMLEWAFHLVPRGGGGSDLQNWPAYLAERFERYPGGTDIDRLKSFIEQNDPAKSVFDRVVARLPTSSASRLSNPDLVAVGSVNDAEFNGAVVRCGASPDSGHVVMVPLGGYMLGHYTCVLYMLASPAMFGALVSEAAAVEHVGPQPFHIKARRFNSLRRWKKAGPSFAELADAMELLLRRHVSLGVADPPDIMRGFDHIPLPGAEERIGHPIEAGAFLTELANEFLMLHECGHIILDHLSPRSHDSSEEQEYAADRWAFEMIVQTSPTAEYATGCFIGAAVLLLVSARLTTLEGANPSGTHPPAAKRIDRLLHFVRSSANLDFRARWRTYRRVVALLKIDEAMRKHTDAGMPGFRNLTGNALTWLLDSCCVSGDDLPFKDQVPRWISQAIPDRFCSALANERAKTEQRLRYEPDDPILKSRLVMILWAFDGTKGRQSRAEILLGEAYDVARKRFDDN